MLVTQDPQLSYQVSVVQLVVSWSSKSSSRQFDPSMATFFLRGKTKFYMQLVAYNRQLAAYNRQQVAYIIGNFTRHFW